MLKKLFSVIMVLLFTISVARAQDGENARLRVVQLSFIPQVSAVVDVRIDDAIIFEEISFPFATDYVELAPGDYTLTTTIVDRDEATASTPLTVESGHGYSLIVHGDYMDQVAFTIIDENDLPLEETGSAAIVLNLTPQPITDIYLDEQMVLESIPDGGHSFISLPVTEFVLSGSLGDRTYSEAFIPLSNAILLVIVRLTPSDDPQVIYYRSSNLTIGDYLQSIDEGAHFARIAELISSADLLDSVADDGAFTLFLPTNETFDRLISDGFPTDTDQMHDLLGSHIIAQNLPPYLLPDNEMLTTLTGSTVLLSFADTASGYWEIKDAPILWDIRLANGVIYAIDGVIVP